jgi:type IV pilus assembly protein PilY1
VAINGSGVTTECQVVSDSGWGNIGTCAASNPSTGPTVTCQVGSDSGWVNIGTCSAANPAAGPTVTCQVGSDSGFVNAGSCTAGNPAAGPTVTCQTTNPGWSNTGSCTVASINGLGQTVECQTSNGAWANSGTCTPAAINGSGVITECQETSNSGWENIATCAASNPSTGPTITCQTSSDSGWVSTGSCTPSAPAAGPVVTCNPVSDTGWVNVSACTPDASALPPVECQTVTKNDGHQLQYRTTQTEQIYQGAAQTGTLFSTATGSASAWANSGSCSATLPTIPASGPVEPSGAQLALPSGCAAWPCQTAINTYGSANSLADVAQYYYKTELRPLSSFGACNSPVKALGTGTEDDKATWQHMTTFTLGLGVSGTLTYQADYKSSSTGAFAGLRAGTVDWPVPVIDTNSVDGDLVEPKYAVDDLWHAAVNGRGQYFSAGRPEDVVSGLGTALSAIDADKASAAGVAVSSQQLLASGNMAYLTSYVTKKWTGDVQAYELNPQTGDPGATVIWDAQLKLDAATKNACDNRTIKLFRQGATDNLVDFSLGTYLCDSAGAPTGSPVTGLNSAEQDYFSAALITGQVQSKPALSQVASMTDTQKAAAAGAKLINYLRGQRGNETFIIGNDAKLFRARDHVLGDIVYAAPQLVAAPFAGYDDKGYAAYKVAQAARTSMLYVAANDGMLHAFRAGTSTTDATGGTEAWAFIPSMVLPNLYKLAGESYSSEHIFLVDGTPTAGDICSSNCTTNAAVWKTILVGGLRKGGKGYYALDVTNPDSPKALWEFKSGACFDSSSVSDQFTDCHIGYSYGAPLIAKLRDGRWAVFVSSGYNNVNSPTVTGDGMGYLFVLDAVTGKIIYKISTNTGSATTPSGLVNLNGRSTSPLRNNTADYIYGTDLLGNIWRFDVNDLILPNGIEATLLATLLDTQGLAQAITTTPAVGEVNGEPYVYVATGRYLGSSDLQLPDPIQKQTIWGIKDPLSDSAVIDLRATLKKVTTATVGTDANAYRTNSCVSSVLDHCNSTAGWYLDLPEDGERVNIDMKLELGTLIVASNVPPVCRCEIGGTSWLNYVDATQGTAVNTSTNVVTGTRPKDAQGKPTQVVGLNVIRTVTGEVKVLATTRQGTIEKPQIPIMAPQVVGKRVSWLEIVE